MITLAYGQSDAEPWPHQWLDYERQNDGSYRYHPRSPDALP